MYYVCGWFDTRGEIDIKGVTKSEKKARKWVESEIERTRNYNIRQWPAYRKTGEIK